MRAAPDLAPIGALIGEPARAKILSELLDGRALTATELATRAGVSPSTASVHLARLVAGELLAVDAQGRHRYFRLARPRVARALETLAGLTAPGADTGPAVSDLRFARTCYDHLAGWLGVAVNDALVRLEVLAPSGSEFRVTRKGDRWMAAFGVDLAAARAERRAFARACLDWSERRHHLAGSLGRAVLGRLLQRGWLTIRAGERTLDLTPLGTRELLRQLGISLSRRGLPSSVRPNGGRHP